VLGDRIKVRISAPAEDGRANQAVLKLMAECLGHPLRQIELTAGHHAPEKTVLIHETEAQHVSERLLKKR
jgi:hypothetical protein